MAIQSPEFTNSRLTGSGRLLGQRGPGRPEPCDYGLLEYKGEAQMLVIGPFRSGALLELIIPVDPQRIIHADSSPTR